MKNLVAVAVLAVVLAALILAGALVAASSAHPIADDSPDGWIDGRT